MSLYMGRNETSNAVTEALELLRKYPDKMFAYNPNDPLANSVVTYLKKQGKIVVNRFHQFQAAPKYAKNPAPAKGARMNRLWKLALAADAAFMRAVKKQFPKERAGDARYKSAKFNAATRKAAERMQRMTDNYLSLLRRK